MESFGNGFSRLIEEDKNHGIIGLVVASLLFGVALIWFKKDSGKKNTNTVDDSRDAGATAKTEESTGADEGEKTQAKGDGKLRNVFSVKQKPMVHGNGSRNKASSDRPFESSYYFAHNKHSTGGGYKDGLRAEDYVMNGPKLLSKGGVRVDDEPPSNETDSEECMQSEQNNKKETPKPKLTSSTPITKYMWDDDGNGNVAKIHIDSLPKSSTETMKWENANISRDQVDVRLIGENNGGLYVGIKQEGKQYHLHIPKMYGEADSVKSIVKKHKLLIKITKKKIPKRYSNRYKTGDDEGFWKLATNAIGNLARGGAEAKEEFISVPWPRLSASSVGGLGGGTADIDEKMFKEMDVNSGGDDLDLP
ncbi:hypothetical protein ACHAXR_005622 [Thalassiosira sp. AJA248-18]